MIRRFFIYAAIVAVFPILTTAHEYHAGSLFIVHPWARATPKGIDVGGGYMKITNQGKTSDRLIGGSLSVARRVVVHKMTMDNGIMKMRPMLHGLEIKPGATVELNPETFHLMFEGLQNPLIERERVKGTLVFEKAGTVNVDFAVESMGATSATASSKSGTMPASMGSMSGAMGGKPKP